MDADAALDWLERYGGAWEAHDGEAAAALFADDASYHWGPFEAALVGREAIRDRWTAATDGQGKVSFSAEVLGVDGMRAFARWKVSMSPASGEIRLDGIFVLDFAEDGRCLRLQEWWMDPAEA
jgi:hypothetical protein